MHRAGLHGKSFIPLIMGFGCNVPAIMATRTIESRSSRIITVLITPFMSCSARLPVLILFTGAFFPKHAALVLMGLYLLGIVVAIITARLLRIAKFHKDETPFVMELPPYRMPTCKSLMLHMWDRGRMYLQKAGTIILATSIILYICNNFPEKQEFSVNYDAQISAIQNGSEKLTDEQQEKISAIVNAKKAEQMEYTISGRIGKFLEPVFRPIGFDWRTTTASIGALAAKEIFVAQMGILFAEGETDEESEPLRKQLVRNYSRLQAFCIMLFCLLSIPCLATLAVIKRELNSWKMAAIEAGALFALAYISTFIVYQLGTILKIGTGPII
jgi:ferrous iron transport protein B